MPEKGRNNNEELSSLDGKSSKKTTVKPSLKTSSKSRGETDLRPLYAFFATLVLYIVAILLCNKGDHREAEVDPLLLFNI